LRNFNKKRGVRAMTDIKKLLMVDDDEDLLALLKLKLEKTGRYKVVTTIEGSEAINLARKETPDLVILDIDMPEMDGVDVARTLLEAEDAKDIPILFLSSLVSEEDVDASGGIIAGRHMSSKKGNIQGLINRIESMLK